MAFRGRWRTRRHLIPRQHSFEQHLDQAVSTGLKTTFEIFSKTKNEAAVNVLVPALESPHPHIQEGALRSILDRRSTIGSREIVRRLHTVNDRWREILEERRGRMSKVLREGLIGQDPQMCTNSCQAILWFREYDLVGPLINAVEDRAHPQAALICETLVSMSDLLSEEVSAPRDYSDRRDPQLVRRNFVTVLERSVGRFAQHKRVEIIESFVMLAKRDNAQLKHILGDPHHAAYLSLIDTMSHSRRPGVMRLLLSLLEDTRPPLAATQIVAKRTDPRFVQQLLRMVGEEPSENVARNLRRIESIAWASPGVGVLTKLDSAMQRAAVKAVIASGMPRLQAFKTVKYLLQHGKPAGQRAATEALVDFQGAEANALVQKAIHDEDPQVQALALRQFRQRGIAGALPLLIEKLDSPQAVVRGAARKSLPEFSFARFLAGFEALDDNVQHSTGRLVKKVDLQSGPLLETELKSKIRSRRLRGLDIVNAMDLAAEVQETLILLLDDEDHMVRQETIHTLETVNTPAVRSALALALDDSSPMVREAAAGAIDRMNSANADGNSPVDESKEANRA